jgi:hypothetical protein
MKRFVLFLILVSAASSIHAQDRGVVLPPVAPAPPIREFPRPFGVSTSAVDRNGNVFILDTTYSIPATADPLETRALLLPAAKTHITLIVDGQVTDARDYDGAMQILGAGRHAVYAFATAYAAGPAPVAVRRLLALRVGADRKLVWEAPFIESPIPADPKLAEAVDDAASDTIVFVDSALAPRIMIYPPPPRYARIAKYHPLTNFPPMTTVEIK